MEDFPNAAFAYLEQSLADNADTKQCKNSIVSTVDSA